MESQKEKKRSDPEAVQRLEAKQRQQAARSLRTDFAGAQKTTYEQVENNPDKPPWWNVDSYIEALEKLGQHDAMHFFDINQKETVRTTKKIRLNPMLPPLIESIVKSAQVKPSVKLPLAIRLDDDNDVKTLCDAHGIAMGRAQNELSSDSRLLLFAAFHDQGKVVERLLDTGFELHQIDILVALEIQRALDKPHLVKEDSAPDWWVRSQFQAGADPDLVRHARFGHPANKLTQTPVTTKSSFANPSPKKRHPSDPVLVWQKGGRCFPREWRFLEMGS